MGPDPLLIVSMSAYSTHDFPSLLELGVWLPQYEMQQRLQTGQDGALYLGRQSALDRKVVIEVIPEPEDPTTDGLLDRLRLRARLVHPSITAVFDFGRTPSGFFYLVSEHVDGTFLESLIDQRLLKPKTAFPLALQICEALQIVHDLQIAHGALSPATVKVNQEGQAKLTGIGMVPKPTGELSWLEPFHGSFSDDIIALGITLHWMFAKCAPSEDGRLSRDLPPAFAGVLRRCLETDPARQLSRPAEVAAALKDALRDEQEKTETPTRQKMIVAPGAKQPTAPVAPAAPPPKIAPGQLQPIVRHYQPSFFQRLDAFVWKAFSTGLHMVISLLSVGSLILLILFKDRIVIEEEPVIPKLSAEQIAEIEADEKPIPAAVLGALPPMEALPTTSAPVKPITLPPPAPPIDPLAEVRAQYISAVQEAANQALEKVRLDDLPYLQKELQLLQNGGDVPSVDEPNLPTSLKALRQRYRELLAGRMK